MYLKSAMSIVLTYTYTKTRVDLKNEKGGKNTDNKMIEPVATVSVVEDKVLDVPFVEKDACKQLGGR